MAPNPNLSSALIGAAVVLLPGAATFLVSWGATGKRIDALESRIEAVEAEADTIASIRADVSYIRGVLDGEARAARTALEKTA
jgi:hypothetical protein